jgi:YVTN family beta-propeller protein
MKKARNLILLALAGAAAAAAAGGKPYAVVRHLPLGGEGGWDYPSVDPKTHLLYLSRADHVSVVDTRGGKEIARIGDTPGVHGIALAPELGRGFISAGKADQVKVFDLKTRAVLATVPTGAGPDAILYDPASRRVFAFNGHGQSVTVIDAKSAAVVATLPLGGKPEFARADGRGMVYANIEDTAELVAIDAKAATLKARWPLPQCEEPSGLALDAAHRRSFSTCGNQTLAILDIDSGRAVANLPIGSGVDGAEFDPARQSVFSANGEGTLSVVLERGPDDFVVQQTLQTRRGARTIALDAATHKLYLPTAEFGPAPEPSADTPHPRPKVLSGTFEVLVVAQAAAGS